MVGLPRGRSPFLPLPLTKNPTSVTVFTPGRGTCRPPPGKMVISILIVTSLTTSRCKVNFRVLAWHGQKLGPRAVASMKLRAPKLRNWASYWRLRRFTTRVRFRMVIPRNLSVARAGCLGTGPRSRLVARGWILLLMCQFWSVMESCRSRTVRRVRL